MRIENFSTTMESVKVSTFLTNWLMSLQSTQNCRRKNALLKQVNGIKRKVIGVVFNDNEEIVAKVPRKKVLYLYLPRRISVKRSYLVGDN
jgi:hypothetical protein